MTKTVWILFFGTALLCAPAGGTVQSKDEIEQIKNRFMLGMQKAKNEKEQLKLVRTAIEDATRLIDPVPNDKEYAKALLFLLELHLLNGDAARAVEIIETYTAKFPQADDARLMKLRRIELLMGLDRIQAVLDTVPKILPEYKSEPLQSLQLQLILSRAHLAGGNLSEASRIVEHLKTEFKDGRERWTVLLWSAALARLEEDIPKTKSILADIAKNCKDRNMVGAAEYLLSEAERIGTTLEPFRVTDTRGQPFSTADQKGKVVAILFWATPSEPSVQLLRILDGLIKKHGADGFSALGICLDEQKDSLEKFLKANPMDVPHYQDAGQDMISLFEVRGLPHLFLIDRKGTIRFSRLDAVELPIALAKLLKEK